MAVQIEARPNGASSVLAPNPPQRKRSLPRWTFILLLAAAAIATAVTIVVLMRSRTAPSYATVPVVSGPLAQTVTASGTINAQDTISVGTQVSGTIATLYVDYNSRVHKGQVLAQIDPSQFQAQVQQARASLMQAQAQAAAGSQSAGGAAYGAEASNQAVASARADLVRAKAAFDLAQRTMARDRALLRDGYLARSQYDSDYSADIAAASALRAAGSALRQSIAQAQEASAGGQRNRAAR